MVGLWELDASLDCAPVPMRSWAGGQQTWGSWEPDLLGGFTVSAKDEALRDWSKGRWVVLGLCMCLRGERFSGWRIPT